MTDKFKTLFDEWDRLLWQAERDGNMGGGTHQKLRCAGRRMVENAVSEVYNEASRWTRRCDDAKRIPDLIWDFKEAARSAAADAELRTP